MPKSRKKKNKLREKKYEEDIMKIEDDYDEISESVEIIEEVEVDDESSDESVSTSNKILIDDEEEHADIVMEIDENNDNAGEDNIINDLNGVVLSKHSQQGKHSLKYDSIFKGKKEDPMDDESSGISAYFNDNFEVDRSSVQWLESMDNEKYNREKKVKERIYEILLNKTDVSFNTNRRKPSKEDFNKYYQVLKENLTEDNFSNVEIFNELSVYFSDNLFNMFKLLNNKWKSMIIEELQNHIGEHKTEEIVNRNISYGTEVEFSYRGDTDNVKIITGVVIKCYYDRSEFVIDSYENIYTIKIDTITKILNNRKFKNNLNKLKNIDFL